MRVSVPAMLLIGVLSLRASATERVDRLVGATVLGVRISVDTFKTIQSRLGPSALRRLQGFGNESPGYICYRSPSGQAWFWFQSSSAGVDDPIDTIVMASHPRLADEECTVVGDDADQEGIRKLKLGMKRNEVAKLFGKRACSDSDCRWTETRSVPAADYGGASKLTLSVIAALKADRVDSITLWRDESQ